MNADEVAALRLLTAASELFRKTFEVRSKYRVKPWGAVREAIVRSDSRDGWLVN